MKESHRIPRALWIVAVLALWVTLTAACVGDTLSLGVEGVVLGQVKDTAFSQGDVGLAAGSWADAGFGVAFSSLEVRSP